MSPTLLAIVLVVALGGHVLICCVLCTEHRVAYITRYLRPPIIRGAHVLARRVPGPEFFGTSLAIVGRGPVIYRIHMLDASTIVPGMAITGLALVPMIIVLYMIVRVL